MATQGPKNGDEASVQGLALVSVGHWEASLWTMWICVWVSVLRPVISEVSLCEVCVDLSQVPVRSLGIGHCESLCIRYVWEVFVDGPWIWTVRPLDVGPCQRSPHRVCVGFVFRRGLMWVSVGVLCQRSLCGVLVWVSERGLCKMCVGGLYEWFLDMVLSQRSLRV